MFCRGFVVVVRWGCALIREDRLRIFGLGCKVRWYPKISGDFKGFDVNRLFGLNLYL